jgi:peptide/nickel transport system substrate-binding protein
MRIRQILLAAPVVVLLLFLVAFAISRPYFGQRQEQLVMSSTADPEILNPILSTTVAAGIIQSFVFDGLMRLDENAQVEPALAEDYHLTQTTHLHFETAEQAAQAAQAIQDHRPQWEALGLQEVKVDADTLELVLSKPGTGYQEVVFGWIGQAKPLEFQRWQVQIAPDAKWEGLEASSDAVIAWLEKSRVAAPQKPRVIYGWKNTSTSMEIYTVGADGLFMDSLQKALAEAAGVQFKPVTAPAGTPTAAAAAKMQLRTEGPLQVQYDRSWPARDEPLITFHLHKGVKWHDGEPFTSADVRFTYDSLMFEKNASPRRSDFEVIKAVETPDDHTFLVRYKEPYSPCLYSWGMDIIPRHILAKEPSLRTLSAGNDFNKFPIGTGPFRMEKWATNQYISLVRNEQYWEGRPHLPRIVYRVIPDPTVSQMEFQTGGFDYAGIEPHQEERYRKDTRYQIYEGPSNSYNYIGWNMANPLFADKTVRKALAHAIDSEAIIKYVMYGNGRPATGPYTPVTPWWNPDVKPIPYDPAKAKALLAEAGWKDSDGDGVLDKDGKPFRFTLITNNGVPVRKDIAVLTQQYLKRIGIGVEVIEYEWAVFIKQYIDARNFDACVLGWSVGFDQDLYQIFHSSQVKLPGSLNFVSYENAEVDALIEKARTEFDLEKVAQYTHRISELVYDDQPYCFLFYPQSLAAMPKGLYTVKRPDKQGQWIEEPIRRTKLGFGVYQKWWMRGQMAAHDQPSLSAR